ncbi:DUF1931 domain-containing protein [Candidatus Woesearchaeota archaeon]|nr:DUF1931 domain-containing protein [Candidatus Woesearchaeota archaeon]
MTGIVVKAKVKELAKGMNISTDFMPKMDEEVNKMVVKALDRARANNRKTVMARDI